VNFVGLPVGLVLIVTGAVVIWLRNRIAQNLPAVTARPSFRNFPRKNSPKSVAAAGFIFIVLGLIPIAFYIHSIS